ncbi:hypothetical protein HBI56_175200 [Parastagonospora nodorum]|nr:hypothetical protein HBH53_186940 [Parastagonospora nodorum]KAH3961692.1 hypothetical protein HBH51_182120 [Parastagonospora nodorum]KAH3968397.1 hypothetical protein HBH52_179020 [Parastagonospora nodorum]KAH3993457.1 hypothetical protein HBI10_202480 [Parastagonospora nodorum]KAH4011707.1 hypothetical protein HBI13_195760 [Parastagonospora nodorum]
MQKFTYVLLCSALSTATARVILPMDAIASLANLKQRQEGGDDPSAEGVKINYLGCDNNMRRDISDAWDDAVKLAENIKDIDTATDIGSFDFFGPNMQTEGAGYKILNVYNNAATYGQTLLWGWRVNAFCPPADKDLLRSCTPGTVAFQWNTLCADGRCVCDTRDSNGKCNKRDQWNNDPDKSYINIQFCDDFFKQQTLQQTIDAGKNAPKESKYNLDYYWHSKGKILFHELLHGATVGTKANENLGITDLVIRIRKHNKPDEFEDVGAYGPLNAKMLARTIRENNFDHVRQNDDNWTGYALAKYIQKTVGVYPILPLADGYVYADSASYVPHSLLLLGKDKDDKEKVYVNNDYYTSNLLSQAKSDTVYLEGGPTLDEKAFGYNPDSDYPKWYIERIRKASNGDLDGTGPVPTPGPPNPQSPESTIGTANVIVARATPGPPNPPRPESTIGTKNIVVPRDTPGLPSPPGPQPPIRTSKKIIAARDTPGPPSPPGPESTIGTKQIIVPRATLTSTPEPMPIRAR